MVDRDFDFDEEPLWFVPETLQERMLQGSGLGEDRSFQLSSIYNALNVLLMLLLGSYAFLVGESELAMLEYILAAVLVIGHVLILVLEWRPQARHFSTFMMAVICLALFINGGLEDTGPLYYFVFPIVALSLNGRMHGVVWVLVLLFVTMLIWQGWLDLALPDYNDTFVVRMVGFCLVITLLASIPEYYRSRAERNLLLNWGDMEHLSFGDARTGLANRSLLQKLLHMEYQRHQRYDSPCSLLFMQADPVINLHNGAAVHVDAARLLAAVIRRNLRVQDFAGRWDDRTFLLLLPGITTDGAIQVAERLQEAIARAGAEHPVQPLRLHASMGIAEFDGSPLSEMLHRTADHLAAAQRGGGNRYVA